MKKDFRHIKTFATNKQTSASFGPGPRRRISAFLALLLLFAACVSQPPGDKKAPAKVPSPETAKITDRAVGDGLDTPRFRNLPPEAQDYLKTLATAFRKKDREFLVSQGEAQYEKELRFTLDEETYLAMLYRIGPYSEDLPWESPRNNGANLPRLDVSVIRGIEYTGWEESGPMLEIKGRLYIRDSEPIPCTLILIWRLTEPKILGERPR